MLDVRSIPGKDAVARGEGLGMLRRVHEAGDVACLRWRWLRKIDQEVKGGGWGAQSGADQVNPAEDKQAEKELATRDYYDGSGVCTENRWEEAKKQMQGGEKSSVEFLRWLRVKVIFRRCDLSVFIGLRRRGREKERLELQEGLSEGLRSLRREDALTRGRDLGKSLALQ